MIDLTLFENPAENIYVLTRWNWDYLEAESFQLKCVDFVYKNPDISLLLICSHPHCYTLGRGLQKIKETSNIALVDFNPESITEFPVYQIKRGGGLTFHYPGQIVFYPIISLTKHKIAVFDLMLMILEIAKFQLESQFNFPHLEIKRDLLGLWFANVYSNAKIASIGLAASRYITYHGLALNFTYDSPLFNSLKDLHPCGLPGDIYKDIETLTCETINVSDREIFVHALINQFINYLMIDKHKSSSLINASISSVVC